MAEKLTPRTLQLADVALGLLQISVLHEATPAETATDPETGETVVLRPARPLRLRFRRTYRIVDDAGRVVGAIPARDIKLDVAFDKLPAVIANGLAAIDEYTRRQARIEAQLLDITGEG